MRQAGELDRWVRVISEMLNRGAGAELTSTAGSAGPTPEIEHARVSIGARGSDRAMKKLSILLHFGNRAERSLESLVRQAQKTPRPARAAKGNSRALMPYQHNTFAHDTDPTHRCLEWSH